MNTITQRQAGKIADTLRAGVARDGQYQVEWNARLLVEEKCFGFTIQATAFCDMTDTMTKAAMVKWLRANSVERFAAAA